MTPPAAPTVTVTGVAAALGDRIGAVARLALEQLDCQWRVSGVTVCVDDHEPDAAPWFGTRDPLHASRKRLVLFCSDTELRAREQPRTALPLAPVVWEQKPAPRDHRPWGPDEFSPDLAARFFHHNFLFADDILAGRLDPALVPARVAEAFQGAWAVTIDGRLAARDLPGYSRAVRRASFSRLFAAAGVLLPVHWEVFAALWEGKLPSQGMVLEALQRLPALG